MTVYVDNAFIPAQVGSLNARWCHLLADSDEELATFAVSIGLRRLWIQHDERRYGAHFDLTQGRRVAAVRAGAVEVDWHLMSELMAHLTFMRGNPMSVHDRQLHRQCEWCDNP